MPLTFLLLRTVNATVNVFTMKLNYSEPKIFTGGVDISTWTKLNKSQKASALAKDWFVYFSFRDPKSGKLKKQPFIKAGANKLKTKAERYRFLRTMQKALLELLEAGFNPFEDNSVLTAQLYTKEELQISKKVTAPTLAPIKDDTYSIPKNLQTAFSISQAFEKGLELKEQMMNRNSFINFRSRISLFQKWLIDHKIDNNSIDIITKSVVNEYLKDVLIRTSPRTRNNTRTDLSSLFQVLEDNEFIKENFIKKVSVLKSVPKRNKTYTPKLQKDIYSYLEKEDPHLLLFIKFISYNYLRPVEVCRLRIKDIDITDAKLYVKAKNQAVKIKIIPEILIKELPDLSKMNPKDFLFTPTKIGGVWECNETNKRNFFTKRFKKIKEQFNLGEDYGLYSFRHTFITLLYRKIRKVSATSFEAKSKLMLITGHATILSLDKYLRDIDAELPPDYSEMLY
jgi:integrase